MTPDLSNFYIARLTLETLTPLSIAAGGADGVFDIRLVRDANGLPALPGSSLAGVLRHLYCTIHGGAKAADGLFGCQHGDDGEASRLHVSWGAIQDSKGRPVQGLLLGTAGKQRLADPVLKAVIEGTDRETRDRVRIGHRGAAADTGKFDRVVLPAGHRFSAEISMWSDQDADARWTEVLGLLRHPLFRLGGGTRAGLGRLKVQLLRHASFDLRTETGREGFAALPRGLGDMAQLANDAPEQTKPDARFVSAMLKLKPRAFWRIGEGEGGDVHLSDDDGKPADLLPKLETRWDWDAGAPKAAELLIPASSLKGVLAHRVAFHANRRAQRWAEKELLKLPDYDKSEHCSEVRELFGYARDDRGGSEEEPKGQAGKVFIDDGYLHLRQDELKLMMHNAIDRFTGGVREHMLFSEELVWRGEIALELVIDTNGVNDGTRVALRDALDDICKGRATIGGGAGKGHGFCDGSLHWSDQGAWISAVPEQAQKQASTQQEAA